jgi:putative hemolysin
VRSLALFSLSLTRSFGAQLLSGFPPAGRVKSFCRALNKHSRRVDRPEMFEAQAGGLEEDSMSPQLIPDQPNPLSVSALLGEPLRGILHPAEPAIDKLFALDRLRDLYRGTLTPEDLLARLDVRFALPPEDAARIPATGPALFVSNHPYGLLDAVVLSVALPTVRRDLKIVASTMLRNIPMLRDRCFFVDNLGRADAASANSAAVRDCIRWLRNGGALLTFPAGEVAHWNIKDGNIADPKWSPVTARMAQIAKACVVPVFVPGANSAAFHVAGAIHPMLRTASLPREFLNKRGQTVEVRVGRPIDADTLRKFDSPEEACEYLRCRTYLLEGEPRAGLYLVRMPRREAAIAKPAPKETVAREIADLPADRVLTESSGMAVYVVRQSESPAVVREMGRLREISFRRVGEGSGRALDLDPFDGYYDHLALWDREAREIVGAYRLAPTPDVLAQRGLSGLYTSTLFRYSKELLDRVGPAVELGRSFIRPEYQKQYAPLLLLWKAIGCYVARRPECATLFGAVSISNDYHPVSRHLLVRFLQAHRRDALSSMVAPRCAYRPDERLFRKTGAPQSAPVELEDLDALIAGLERDGKGVPILIRQYLKTGGRLLGFNVDRRFSNALDALIMVDLRSAPVALLDRYMGKTRAAEFRAFHAH